MALKSNQTGTFVFELTASLQEGWQFFQHWKQPGPRIRHTMWGGAATGEVSQNQVLGESLVQHAQHDTWRELESTTDGNSDCHSWGSRSRQSGIILRGRAGSKE